MEASAKDKHMTHTLLNSIDSWTFQPAGTSVYVTQTRRCYTLPSGRTIRNQVMTQCDYTIQEARELWALLTSTGAAAA